MAAWLKTLLATFAASLVLAGAAESASASYVYRANTRIGRVYTFAGVGGVYWVDRWGLKPFEIQPTWIRVGKLTHVPGTANWNVYRGTDTKIGSVGLAPAFRWNIYLPGFSHPPPGLVGYVRRFGTRWWVYRGSTQVGTVSGDAFGGAAAGAAALLLM